MERTVAGFGLLVAALLAIGARAAPGATYDQRQEGKVNVQIDVKDVQIVALVDSDMLEDYTNYDYAYDYADFTIKPRPTQSSKPTTSSSSSSSSTTAETWSTWPTKPSADSSSTTASPQKDELLSSTASLAIVPSTNSSTIGNSTILIIPLANGTAAADPIKIGSNDTDLEKHDKPESSTAIVVEISTEAPKQVNDAGTTSASSDLGSTSSDEDIKIDEQNKRPPANPEPRKRCPAGFLLKSGRCFKRRLSLISPRLAFMKLAPALLGKSAQAGFASAVRSS